MNHNFEVLTGHTPFPWQEDLYHRFVNGTIPPVASVPTGLGKTNVIAVWLLALMEHTGCVPRRLVYVVNRRTVVDQTTAEVEKLRENLPKLSKPAFQNLAISTLRGQFADNREWSTDPSRPAVICGTVDMIGSRLLFSGYGVGFKSKPLHAGFLGQDVLLVHDEAHLEPAFQHLLVSIEKEQKCCNEFARLKVMELTATTRGGDNADCLRLSDADHQHPIVEQRIKASKRLKLISIDDNKNISDEVAERALQHKDGNSAVLVFLRTLDDVNKTCGRLTDAKTGVPKERVQKLTGTMRGQERDNLVKSDPVFARFLQSSKRSPDASSVDGTVYLVCTSAGEVGIDISADHMLCDLSTFDSMAQRFGRVNRYGERNDTRIDVVHPKELGKIDKAGKVRIEELDVRRKKTLELLQNLPQQDDGHYDASPLALDQLDPVARQEAFTPPPLILPATDILFDAWAMTSIRTKMPGRPPVEPYLHGISEREAPHTTVAWRKEVEIISEDLLKEYKPEDLLEEYSLKPHELLNDTNKRIFKELQVMQQRLKDNDCPLWLVDQQGVVEVLSLKMLLDEKGGEEKIEWHTILLPPSAGGLSGGFLDGESSKADDVADIGEGTEQRIRIRSGDPEYNTKTKGMRLVLSIEPDTATDDEQCQTWDWFKVNPPESGRTAQKPVLLETHTGDVEREAGDFLAKLLLPDDIAQAVKIAARLHDQGKKRQQFQNMLGNRNYPALVLAKSGRAAARLPETCRHEFASLVDTLDDVEFKKLSPEMQELVLHIIAAHHGRARPHFSVDESYDPEQAQTDTDPIALEVPRRFARLQRRYGRWGLAYLESLLRAADWAASAEPSAFKPNHEVTHE